MAEVPAPFGKYYLTEKLAAGGMAEIYLGKLVGPGGFEKLLVIKQIHPRYSGLRHFVDLFVAEAKTLVTLVHGNIVPVYELGVIGDTYYIAMEYIDGPSLYRLTEQLRAAGTPMAPALAAHIATKILDGLDYAHRKGEGVIHRDLSGRNVMISRDGDVKIVDFGIAVSLGDAGDHAGELPAGSFPYMSPEQVRREPLTGQSDLFSAGILLWEMLTGERLFARHDAATTLQAVTEASIPRPGSLNPAVPGRLDDVVMKALHRDLETRWHTAAEMLAALHRYLYSLAATPGARELSQLVSRYCPPSVRRHHTDADLTPRRLSSSAPGAPDGAHELDGTSSAADGPAAPATAVIPRAPGSQPLRQQAFATHVELAGLLPTHHAGAELVGGEALLDSGPGQVTAVHAAEPKREAAPVSAPPLSPGPAASSSQAPPLPPPPAAPTSAVPAQGQAPAPTAPPSADVPGAPVSRDDDGGHGDADGAPDGDPDNDHDHDGPPRGAIEPLGPRGSTPPFAAMAEVGVRAPAARSRRLAALAVTAVALGAAVVLALWGRSASRSAPTAADDAALSSAGRRDGGADDDAHVGAARDGALPVIDAPTPRAVADAGSPPDAPHGPMRRDAGARPEPPRRDAGARPEPPRDAEPVAAAPATIRVGANPWGEVFLDGKQVGRTPTTLQVPAGRHEIEVVFPVVDPPRRETYRLELGAGETRAVLADFSQ